MTEQEAYPTAPHSSRSVLPCCQVCTLPVWKGGRAALEREGKEPRVKQVRSMCPIGVHPHRGTEVLYSCPACLGQGWSPVMGSCAHGTPGAVKHGPIHRKLRELLFPKSLLHRYQGLRTTPNMYHLHPHHSPVKSGASSLLSRELHCKSSPLFTCCPPSSTCPQTGGLDGTES